MELADKLANKAHIRETSDTRGLRELIALTPWRLYGQAYPALSQQVRESLEDTINRLESNDRRKGSGVPSGEKEAGAIQEETAEVCGSLGSADHLHTVPGTEGGTSSGGLPIQSISEGKQPSVSNSRKGSNKGNQRQARGEDTRCSSKGSESIG